MYSKYQCRSLFGSKHFVSYQQPQSKRKEETYKDMGGNM